MPPPFDFTGRRLPPCWRRHPYPRSEPRSCWSSCCAEHLADARRVESGPYGEIRVRKDYSPDGLGRAHPVG
ncbi:hypothetical protein ACFVVX_03370 [Kitasatospora sp. NPDC058170]|uniref:hypothetical protein n=1 Tax=Kitasatospora sp. NPDC058170 TaxID=3346364 RepID=UPI0036D85CE5